MLQRSGTKARTQALNQLRALLVTTPDDLLGRLQDLTQRDLPKPAARAGSTFCRPVDLGRARRRAVRSSTPTGSEVSPTRGDEIVDPLLHIAQSHPRLDLPVEHIHHRQEIGAAANKPLTDTAPTRLTALITSCSAV